MILFLRIRPRTPDSAMQPFLVLPNNGFRRGDTTPGPSATMDPQTRSVILGSLAWMNHQDGVIEPILMADRKEAVPQTVGEHEILDGLKQQRGQP